MVRGETDKTASDIQARSFMARTLDEIERNAKLRERQKLKKPKLDNARRLRGICFIDPESKEFKETIKNARKKLETPMTPAMPCKIIKNNKNCGSGASNKVNLQDCVWENHCRIIMKTILQEEEKFIATLQFGSQIYSYASSHENSSSKDSSGQGMGKIEKIPAWDLTKVRSKSEVTDEARKKGRKVHFA